MSLCHEQPSHLYVYMYMEIHVFSILAKKQKKEEKEKQPPHLFPYTLAYPYTHTHTKRAGHRIPSLENWDGALKIFCGMPTLPTHLVSKLTQCAHITCIDTNRQRHKNIQSSNIHGLGSAHAQDLRTGAIL